MRGPTLALFLVGIALIGLAMAGAASAETAITNSTTDQLLVLNVTDSPYVLDHDFHVQPGGFLLISEGVELRMDNGSRLVGDGGSISATGTTAVPAIIGPRPASNFTTWAGIELQNGSTLTLRHARIVDALRAVTFTGIATLDAQFSQFEGCVDWCIRTALNGHVDLRDSTMANGSWGYYEDASTTPVIDNLTVSDFTGGGLLFGPGSSAATVGRVTVLRSSVGVMADHLAASQFIGLTVREASVALLTNVTTDLTFSNSTLSSPAGTAVSDRLSARLSLWDSLVEGGWRALSLNESSALWLLRVNIHASAGTCLYLLNLTNAVLRSVALSDCARTLAVDPASAPPTADANRSNTVEGKPFLWIANAANVRVDVTDDAGLVVVSAVSGATLTDLRLRGAGVHIFGSSAVVVERVLVEDADAGVVAIGTNGLTVRDLVARNVTYGIRVWSTAFFPPTQDVRVENVRVDGALGDGITISSASRVNVLHAYARAALSALNLTKVATALVQYCFFENSTVGVYLANSTDITVVDSVVARNSLFGARVTNVTGYAARNAFIDNAQHASSPGAPGFPFEELGGGNYWSGFTAVNANFDQFYDTPYNFTDGTGQDTKPRVGRLDFGPSIIVLPPGLLEAGVPASLDGSLSFDDFEVSTIYWTVVLGAGNATGSGPLFPFTPPTTGNFTVIAEARDNNGAVGAATFTVTARDSIRPVLGPIVFPRPEVGVNLTVSLPNATDNDPLFPSGAFIEWFLTEPPPLSVGRTGNATSLSFEVPVSREGNFSLRIRLFDRSMNWVEAVVPFQANDTSPPEVDFIFTGEPDLGVPFMIDASQARDPTGVNSTTAQWRWIDAGTTHNSTSFPVVTVTFHDSGNHTVNLTLCDLGGNCGVFSLTLDARDRTGPVLSVLRVIVPGENPNEILADQNPIVQLKRNVETVFEIAADDPSGPVVFSWTFPDGTHAEGSRVTHRFTGVGPGVVTVTMTDSAGNSKTVAVRVNVDSGDPFAIIPGGAFGLVVILALVGGGGALMVMFYRYRRKHQKNY
jgi:hypothetical protein